VWLLVAAGSIAANLPGKFSEAEKNDSASFLPADAESTRRSSPPSSSRTARRSRPSSSTAATAG
jgi:hypothetical protein